MFGGIGRKGTVQSRLLAVIAFVAIAVHALLPPGYMLSAPQRAGQFISLTLCSGHAAPLVLDLSTGAFTPADEAPNDDRSDSNGNAPCVFASAAVWAPPPTSAVAPVALPRPSCSAGACFESRTSFAGGGLAAPPPWSTGPPLA